MKVFDFFEVENQAAGEDAYKIESELHNLFKTKQIDGEYFEYSSELQKEWKKVKLANNG